MSGYSKWVKAEVYPLFIAIGGAIGLCGFHLGRHITASPDVRLRKTDRAAGYLENHDEGQKWRDHGLRRFLAGRTAQPGEIMPKINEWFSGSEHKSS
eukprot:jgi/Chlat1/7742/Chrsp66S07213